MTSRWHARRVTGVVGLPGDRADEVVVEAADAAAACFDRVIVREDDDRRGRRPGEMADLIVAAVRRRNAERACTVVLDEREALRHALESMQPAELVVMFYDHLEPLLEVLRAHHATAVDGGLSAMPLRVQFPAAPQPAVAADRGGDPAPREHRERARRRPA